ncbi:MAG TPA: pitrilysin family protein [Flavisolibacter sp.]|nr:pitrilysin family protein [Flavisolibacter sp.]
MIVQKRNLLTAFASVAFMAAFSQAKLVEKVTKTGDEIVIPYEKYVLPNGLTLVVHEDHSDPVVHVDVTYHVGSAREQIGKSGFAHFFEHMMFEGSDNALKGQHDKIISGGGGSLNGSTNRDRTNYYETIPSNLLEKTIWLEADRMGFLLGQVTQKRFEVQRATVKNERGQRVDNVPYGLASETFSKNLYPYGHPYSWEVIGYIEDLNRGDVNDLKNFFLRWYGPNNATLTIGGDVKTADVVKMVEKYFGAIPRGPEVKPAAIPAPQLEGNRYVSYTDNYARLPLFLVVYPTVPNYNKDMAALQCLAQLIGQGRSSVLYQTLVKKQLALQASSFSRFDELSGEFIFQLTPMQGKSLAQMDTLFHASLDSFEKRGVSDDDIAKFKGSRESQLINGLQSVQGKVTQLANFQTFTGNPNKIADLLKMYSSLTKEDVMAAYNKYLKNKGAVLLSVLPKGQESLVAAPDNFKIDTTKYIAPDYGYAGLQYNKAKDNFDRTKIPGNGGNPVVKVPKFWKKELPNGAKVIGAENTEIPTVTFSLSIPGGHLASAGNLSKAGLASFFTDMMLEDTKNYTAEQLTNELQKLGSSISIVSNVDDVTFTVQSLKKNFDKTLALLEERLYNPKFTQQAFDRLKQQLLQSFKQAKAQPATIANDVFAKVNYGANNILGINEDGTEETVKNITLKDIEGYYTNYMTSQDAKVVIVGDIKQEEVLPKLAFLNKLPKKKIVLQKPVAAPAVDKTKVYLVDVPKGAQTEFRVGYATGLKYDATGDYYKAFLANFPLGGGFNSRLNMHLREEKGWTYGASSRFSGDEYSGEFRFSSGIKADVTDSALSDVMRMTKEYLASGPTDEEMNFMRGAIGQSDALRYETGPQKAQFIRRILDYNLPANYPELQAKILKSMTKQQMLEYTKKYINPEKLNILLVGDKAKILEGVKKLGYEIVELDADGNKVDKKAF